MKIANKPRLRGLMKKLYAAPIDWNDRYIGATADQEALDFVAMAAGLKPVYVTGRGFVDPRWRDTVLGIAQAAAFHVVVGPYWQSVPPDPDLPAWFTEPARSRLAEGEAHYIAKTKSIAAELAALSARGGQPTVTQEARLLGFPECCVAAHYATAAALEHAHLELIRKRAGGEEAEMRRLAAASRPVLPETEEERARLAAALQVRPAPHTSLNMCAACGADPHGPAQALSARYAELGRALMPGRRRRNALDFK